MIKIKILNYFKRPLVVILIALLIPFYFMGVHDAKHIYALMDEYENGEELYGISARILKKEYKNEKYRYEIKLADRRGIITSNTDDLPVESRIIFDGVYMAFEPAANEGCFDRRKYYCSKGISFSAKITSVRITDAGSPVYEWMDEMKNSARRFYEKTLYGEEIGLMSAMALGDKSGLDEDVKDLFSGAGLAHLLAVSGLHISIVGMGLFKCLKKCGLPLFLSGGMSLICVGLYGMLTGLSVSTLRAVIMFFVMMMGEFLCEIYDVGSAAALAAIIILSGMPTSIFDTGFLFSFGAVFGIVYVASPMKNAYEKRRMHRFGKDAAPEKLSTVERLLAAVIFGAGLQFSVLPILVTSYHRISLYVVFLNIFLLPLMGFLVGCGLFLGLIGGGVLCVAGCVPGVFSFLMQPCHLILYLYEMASEISLKLPCAEIVIGQPKAWQILVYYGILLLAINLINEKKTVFLIPAAVFILTLNFSHHMEIDMLSVGQGDGLFIRSREGEVFMVDGGSSSEDELAKYTLLPFLRYKGVSKVSYWFITHMDADHYNGLFDLLQDGFNVEHVVLARSVEKNEAYYDLIKLCDKNDTEVLYMVTGDVCGTKSLSFKCLFPEYPSGFLGTNENSLCLLLSYGNFDMLLTGDMGAEQEQAVLDTAAPIGSSPVNTRYKTVFLPTEIEVLKSAHHGSKNSNSKNWLYATDPDLCIISAGKHNRYHHPSPDTLERLDDCHIPYLCTIDTGEIKIFPESDGRFCVETIVGAPPRSP